MWGNADAHLSVRERVLEVVVRHEAYACLRGIAYEQENMRFVHMLMGEQSFRGTHQ